MRASDCARTLLIWALLWSCLAARATAQLTAEGRRFELRGRVMNAATGAPVGGALVQLYGAQTKAQFSGPDGAFVFADMPRGSYTVTARIEYEYTRADLRQFPLVEGESGVL